MSLLDLLVVLQEEGPEIVKESDEEGSAAPVPPMPLGTWDRRYYRISGSTGEEVLLVKRVAGSRWLVLKPDRSLRVLLTSHLPGAWLGPQSESVVAGARQR